MRLAGLKRWYTARLSFVHGFIRRKAVADVLPKEKAGPQKVLNAPARGVDAARLNGTEYS